MWLSLLLFIGLTLAGSDGVPAQDVAVPEAVIEGSVGDGSYGAGNAWGAAVTDDRGRRVPVQAGNGAFRLVSPSPAAHSLLITSWGGPVIYVPTVTTTLTAPVRLRLDPVPVLDTLTEPQTIVEPSALAVLFEGRGNHLLGVLWQPAPDVPAATTPACLRIPGQPADQFLAVGMPAPQSVQTPVLPAILAFSAGQAPLLEEEWYEFRPTLPPALSSLMVLGRDASPRTQLLNVNGPAPGDLYGRIFQEYDGTLTLLHVPAFPDTPRQSAAWAQQFTAYGESLAGVECLVPTGATGTLRLALHRGSQAGPELAAAREVAYQPGQLVAAVWRPAELPLIAGATYTLVAARTDGASFTLAHAPQNAYPLGQLLLRDASGTWQATGGDMSGMIVSMGWLPRAQISDVVLSASDPLSATLTFTAEAAAQAVVQYGTARLDLSTPVLLGGPHFQVELTGLQPDTPYITQVRVVAPYRSISRSQRIQFTTPPLPGHEPRKMTWAPPFPRRFAG